MRVDIALDGAYYEARLVARSAEEMQERSETIDWWERGNPPRSRRAAGHRSTIGASALEVRPRKRAKMKIQIKRAYEPAEAGDGYRVLIDRLWPRGVTKQRARLDAWEKQLGPSTELRKWFGHEPRRFEQFRRRYIEELRGQRERLSSLRRRARDGTVTLVHSARDTEHNDAVVLAEVLRRGLPSR